MTGNIVKLTYKYVYKISIGEIRVIDVVHKGEETCCIDKCGIVNYLKGERYYEQTRDSYA